MQINDAAIDQEIETIYPLTPMQQGMLFHSVLEPGSGVYIQCTISSLPEALDPEALRNAWRTLIQRHAVLRTAFLWEDLDRPLQVVHKLAEPVWKVLDWRASTNAENELAQLADGEVKHGFALDQAPLMRITLVRMPDASWRQVWTYHHILLDGWSLPILFDELSTLYGATLKRTPHALTRPVRFENFISWLQGRDQAAAAGFWNAQLHGLAAPTPLPDNSATKADAEPSAPLVHDMDLGKQLSSALVDFTRSKKVTLSTLMQAAWAQVLASRNGETDVLFGATVSGRPPELADVETIVGPFINSVPVRIAIPENTTVVEWLARLQADAIERDRFSFSALTDIQRQSSIPAGTALFDTLLVFENYPQSGALAGQIDALGMGDFVTREQTNFKLTINVIVGETICIRFSYDRRRLAPQTIIGIAAQFQTLLAGMVRQPDQLVGALPMLAADEEAAILQLSCGPEMAFPEEACLHDLITEAAASNPAGIAVISGTQSLTNAELQSRANCLAHHLISLGIGPDQRVAICMERGLDMVIALLATLKAGGAYVPVDPGYPADRVAYMLADAAAPVILTETKLRHILPADTAGTLLFVDEPETSKAYPDTAPETTVTATDLAYVIYTSGSTGRPKGAMNSHRGIVNRLIWMQNQYQLGSDDRVLQKTPFSFDVSVWEFFWPLMTGATLVMAKPGGHKDNAYLTELINRERITTIHFVPSMLTAMLDEPTILRCLNLKRVICSGEALDGSLAESFFRTLPTVELHNLYGPTECAVDVTAWPLDPKASQAIVPIGRPIANTNIYILDRHHRLLPMGVAGDVYIAGVQVGLGYLNQPELTADRFIPDPFSVRPDAMMYKSGDIGRWMPDGALEYLGRRDSQVKVRGFRIELGEIDAHIREDSAIRDVVTIMREDRPGDRRLVSYLVPIAGAVFNLDSLRSSLKAALPEYMVPAAYVTLSTLPLSVNGKIDRRALPAPEYQSDQEFVAPRTPTEQALADIMADVLGLGRVGVTDNFFELGGDSILLLQIITRARNAGLQLTARQIFDHPTVSELGRLADQPRGAALAMASGPLPSADQIAPTPIQRWFFEASHPNPHHFNQSMMLDVAESVSADTIEHALRQVIDHHDALRLRFSHAKSQAWRGHIDANAPLLDLLTIDLPTSAESATALIALETQRAHAALNCVDGPTIRAVFFRSIDNQASRLFIVIHHLAMDGVSWRILLEDMQTLCRQIGQRQPIRLPAPTSSFALWSAGLERYALTDTLAAEASYWRTIEDKDDGRIPLDHQAARTANTFASSQTLTVGLDHTTTQALLQTVPRFYQSQINDVLLAALATTLNAWTARSNVLINIEGHGREDIAEPLDLSRTIGWFTSLFPVCLSSVKNDATASIDMMKSQLRAVPARGLGYGVLRYLRTDLMESRTWRNPDVCFNYLGQTGVATSTPASLLNPSSDQTGSPSDPHNLRAHLIDVIGEVRNGQMSFAWSFSQNFHDRQTIQELADQFITALRQMIARAAQSAPVVDRSVDAPSYDPLVIIQNGRSNVDPVFCVPGIGGSVIYFSPLAQRLGKDTPVYGLQPRGLDDDLEPHVTIAEMADAYVEAIGSLKLGASRKVRLLGHSLGSMVIFEMARRLETIGFQLAPLILLDPPTLQEMGAERPKPSPEQTLSMITQFLTNRYGPLFHISEEDWAKLSEDERIEFLRQKMVSFKLISARTPFNIIKSKVRMVVAHGNLNYWPSGPYLKSAAILRPEKDFAKDSPDDMNPETGWVRFAPQLQVLQSDGDHMTILDHVTMNALMQNLSLLWEKELSS